MTTSGIFNWPLSARDLVRAAMGEIAILEPGTEPDADEERDCILRLNGMLKSWSLKGATLYSEETGTITVPAASASGVLPREVRNVASVRLVNSATSERQLFPMGRSDYLSLPNKASIGKPTMYYISRDKGGVEITLWPVSPTGITLKVDYDRSPETVTDATQTVDIREELSETVYANLAVRIAAVFGESPSPELVARAKMLEMEMFDAERPDSYLFVADDAYAYGDRR